MSHETQSVSKNVVTGLSMIGGLGLTLIVIALGIGVIRGDTVDSALTNLLGLMVVAGFMALAGAIIAWIAVVQPHKHFDNINEPLEEEAHH